jgi:hypothetical protein
MLGSKIDHLAAETADKVTYDEQGKKVETHTTVVDPFEALRLEEENHQIKFRTLSWQKTTLLLFGEYVCLAILALAWSWSVLGWVCGFFITFGLGAITWCKCKNCLSDPS